MIVVEVKGSLNAPGRHVLKEIARIWVYRFQGGTDALLSCHSFAFKNVTKSRALSNAVADLIPATR